jgi:hypothetical protein
MSETASEGIGGDTGEVGDAGVVGTASEDQQAEELLHGVMQAEDPEELKRQVDHWKSTAQRHEKTARTNSSAAKRLQEIEDANKTELQRAVDAQQAAERERDATLAQSARMLAASTHELDPDLVDFLGDGSADEINARAEQLSGIIEQAAIKMAEQMVAQNGNGRAPVMQSSRRPVESMRPGAAPASSGTINSPDEMFRNLLNRQQG